MNNEKSQEKTEKYKFLLQKRFWDLYEAAFYFVGVTDFDAYYNLDGEQREIYKIERIGTHPRGSADVWLGHSKEIAEEFKYSESNFARIVKILWRASENDDILAQALKTHFIQGGNKKYTYLIHPQDALFTAITQGFILPTELQIASSLHQIGNAIHQTPMNIGEKRKIQRQAIAQAYLHKYPDISIAEVCRFLDKLKKYSGFEFINDSESKRRDIVSHINKQFKKNIRLIPDILSKEGSIVKFDFQRLHIALTIFAHLFLGANPDLTSQELLNHPLIEQYSSIGGEVVNNVIKFSLKDFFNYR